jgi:hypothetical protein
MATKPTSKPMIAALIHAEAFAAAHRNDPEAQRQWAHTRPPEEREYFSTALDCAPRVSLDGIAPITMEMDDLTMLSWELRELIRIARPVWDQEARQLAG